MSVGRGRKAADDHEPAGAGGWPSWARRSASAMIGFHVLAVLAGAFAAAPSSDLERAIAGALAPYHLAIDQGYAYRYYAPEPGPTPVVTATIRYGDGRPEETIRLPSRGASPRLRYQRQLALANHLVADFREARHMTGDGGRSVYARSYARHLAKTKPGSASIALFARDHMIPDPRRVLEGLQRKEPVDVDAEEFYTASERIGEYSCDVF